MQNTNNKVECKNLHITSSATATPWTTPVQLLSMAICCTNAGTTWTLTIQDKGSTPKILYSKTLALTDNMTYIALTDTGGLEMVGGMDVITSGTAGVVDVWITAMRLGHD